MARAIGTVTVVKSGSSSMTRSGSVAKIPARIDGFVGKLPGVPPGSRLERKEGIDELLECLDPARFDFRCIVRNLAWVVNSAMNKSYLSCNFGTMTPLVGQPGKYVSNGACYSWWGIPGAAQSQQCVDFDASSSAFTTCKNKCTAERKDYDASGCNGQTIWCHCRD